MIFWSALFIAFTAKPAHRLLYIVPAMYYVDRIDGLRNLRVGMEDLSARARD
jgi:hypothetical protein